MSNTCLITFTPRSRFYFGSSRSFGDSYFANSLPFPPLTTALGAIRLNMLKNADKLDKTIMRPIGDFMPLTGTSPMKGLDEIDGNFGKLLKMSPLFIVKNGNAGPEDFLIPVPEDVYLDKDEKFLEIINFRSKQICAKTLVVGNVSEFNFAESVRTKIPRADVLGGWEFWSDYKLNKPSRLKIEYKISEVFREDTQTGIARVERKTIPKYLYRKNDFRLAANYAFGVVVHFADDYTLASDDVFMGGERSLFRMESSVLKPEEITKYGKHPVMNRYLTENDFGDMFSNKGNGKHVCMSANFVYTAGNFGIIPRLDSSRSLDNKKKNDSFRTYPPGSVLFLDSPAPLEPGKHAATKIGYNFTINFNMENK